MALARWQPVQAVDRAAQPRIGNAGEQLVHVVLRAATHGVPLRPVGDLDQAVVAQETNHGGDRKAQHLIGRARPDATDHRQKVALAKRGAEAVAVEESADRLVHFIAVARGGDAGGQPVEAQHVGQHADEARRHQIALLRKHAGEVVAAPLEALLRHLHRERHLRRCRRHAQRLKQLHQVGVGAVVEDQEAGVDAVRDALQRDVDRVRVAAETVVGLEQRDLGVSRQRVRRRQPGNARPDHGDPLHLCPSLDGYVMRSLNEIRAGMRAARRSARARINENGVPDRPVPRGKKSAVQRLEANEGEREEEERRLEIVAG